MPHVRHRAHALQLGLAAVIGIACDQSPRFDPAIAHGDNRRMELVMGDRSLVLEARRPSRPLVAPGATVVTVHEGGVTTEEPISSDVGRCVWEGPVMEGGTALRGSWVVLHGCDEAGGLLVLDGVATELRASGPESMETWTVAREPRRLGTARTRRLPRGTTLQRAVDPPSLWVEVSAVADRAFHLRHRSVKAALDEVLETVAFARALMSGGSLDPSVGMVVSRFTIFTSADPYTYPLTGGEVAADQLLAAYTAWATPNLPAQRDISMLFSGLTFEGSSVGLAFIGAACFASYGHGTIEASLAEPYRGLTLAHETGHLLSMVHDEELGCGDTFVMSSAGCSDCTPLPVFSTCSSDALRSWRQGGDGACLLNVPAISVPGCGDGVLGQGEQCDCGTWCNLDPCCNATTCQFNTGAECSALDPCCNQCRFTAAGTACDTATTCTPSAECTGTSAVCVREYAPAGTTCTGSGGHAGNCYQGDCASFGDQCEAMSSLVGSPLFPCSAQPRCDALACEDQGMSGCYIILTEIPDDGTSCGAGRQCVAGACVATSSIVEDLCAGDPDKTAPGACGCGHPDVDADMDQVADCVDACPTDPRASTTPCPVYMYATGPWSECPGSCGGTRTRSVTCVADGATAVPAAFCTGLAPASSEDCPACTYAWNVGSWSTCSNTCVGVQSRTVECVETPGPTVVVDSQCTEPRPTDTQACNPGPCDAGMPGPPDAGASSASSSSAAVASASSTSSPSGASSSAAASSGSSTSTGGVGATSSSAAAASSSGGAASSNAASASPSSASAGALSSSSTASASPSAAAASSAAVASSSSSSVASSSAVSTSSSSTASSSVASASSSSTSSSAVSSSSAAASASSGGSASSTGSAASQAPPTGDDDDGGVPGCNCVSGVEPRVSWLTGMMLALALGVARRRRR